MQFSQWVGFYWLIVGSHHTFFYLRRAVQRREELRPVGKAIASMAGLPPARIREPLRELVRSRLLSQPSPGRVLSHDLVCLHAADQAREHFTDAERHAVLRRMLDHYLHTADRADRLLYPQRDPLDLDPADDAVVPAPLADHRDALAWFEAEHQVLVTLVGRARGKRFVALSGEERIVFDQDLASVLANAVVDGEPILPFQQISYYVIIATAGHDTTSFTMTGGLQALLENPDQLDFDRTVKTHWTFGSPVNLGIASGGTTTAVGTDSAPWTGTGSRKAASGPTGFRVATSSSRTVPSAPSTANVSPTARPSLSASAPVWASAWLTPWERR